MADASLALAIKAHGTEDRQIKVTLSNELVHLLSEQMYQSPLKAIEELVVNSYDAEAGECRLFVPLPPATEPFLVVYDDGFGMNPDGLTDLWHIGRSSKRDVEVAKRLARKQIGKFGIGKLATYAVANIVTYVTKTGLGVFGVTMDFRDFVSDPTGGQPIPLQINKLDLQALAGDAAFGSVLAHLGLTNEALQSAPTWTFAVLEDLKPKMGRIRKRDLNWVLSTAMPIDAFKLVLNGDEVESSKAGFVADAEVSFKVADISKARLEALEEQTGDGWRIEDGMLKSSSFPQGVSGEIVVTKQSLYTGKSGDLARSHGFFVKVRGRLVEESDPLFGIEPLSYEIFNRFRALLAADDLDEVVTAPREGFEASDLVADFRTLLRALFYEARGLFQANRAAEAEKEKRANETVRNFVNPTFVERPIADVLSSGTAEAGEGSEADDSWFYLRLDPTVDRKDLIERLYAPSRERYRYVDLENGRSGRVVEFDPMASTFFINVDHPLVQAHADPQARPLLEDIVTAEALLEVYLREQGLAGSQVGELLERRDQLLRSLAADHIFSLPAIAGQLRASADDEHDLEVSIVIGARALGFVAKHIGGAGRADGVARFTEYPGGEPGGERRIILEAKSAGEAPSLGAIDFAGLNQHMIDEEASGCLLVAPSYPGGSKGDYAQAAQRAATLKISCWTVEQMASVIEAAEARHISAADIMRVVTSAFTPDQVADAVSTLLTVPTWIRQELYGAAIDALRTLEGRLSDRPRTIDQIASEITREEKFRTVSGHEIRKAIEAIAAASQGLIVLSGRDRVVVRGDYDEIERRVGPLAGRGGPGRRISTFRTDEPVAEDT